jgi:hypothetical protein
MLRNNKCFLDPNNIIEFSFPEQKITENRASVEEYSQLKNETIFKILSSRLISSKISFGACNNSSGIVDVADSDIICAFELKSTINNNEYIQLKISIDDLTKTLIDNNSNFLVTSDKIEEILLILKSFQQLEMKLKYFIDKNSSAINSQIERDTPAW